MRKSLLLVFSLLLVMTLASSALAVNFSGDFQLNIEHALKDELSGGDVTHNVSWGMNVDIDERQSGNWRVRARLFDQQGRARSNHYQIDLTPGDVLGLKGLTITASENRNQVWITDPLGIMRLHRNKPDIKVSFSAFDLVDVVSNFEYGSGKLWTNFVDFDVAGNDLGLVYQMATAAEKDKHTVLGHGTFNIVDMATLKASAGLTFLEDSADLEDYTAFGAEVSSSSLLDGLKLTALYRQIGDSFENYDSQYGAGRAINAEAVYTMDNVELTAKYAKTGTMDDFNKDVYTGIVHYWSQNKSSWSNTGRIRYIHTRESLSNIFASNGWINQIKSVKGFSVQADVELTQVPNQDDVITLRLVGGAEILPGKLWVATRNNYDLDSKVLTARVGLSSNVTDNLTIAPRVIYNTNTDSASTTKDSVNTVLYAKYDLGNRAIWADYAHNFAEGAAEDGVGWGQTTKGFRMAFRTTF